MTNDNTVSQQITNKCNKLTNLLSSYLQIPYCLITQMKDNTIEIISQNTNQEGSHTTGSINNLNNPYCKNVITSKSRLQISNVLTENKWKNNLDLKLGIIAYLGYPLLLPNGKIFGTICVLDKKENNFSKEQEDLIICCKEIIELDLASYFLLDQKRISLEEKLFQKLEKLNPPNIESDSKNKSDLINQVKELSKKPEDKHNNCSKLLNKMNTAIVIFSPLWSDDGCLKDAIYLDMNPMNEKIIGRKKEELIGKRILSVFPKTEAEWLNQFDRIYKSDGIVNFDLYHKQLKKHFSVNAYKLDDDSFCVIYNDVTDKINLNKKLSEQKNQYHSLFNAINTAIVLFEPITNNLGKVIDLRYTDMNPLNEQIMGFKNEEVKNKSMLEVYPETQSTFFNYFTTSLEQNTTVTFEFHIKSLDKYYACSVFPVKDKLAFSCYDISTRIKAIKQKKESEERYKSIFENSSSIMLLIDPTNGKIIDANQSAVDFTEYRKDILLKMTINEINILDPKDIQSQINLTKKEKKKYFEFKHKTASGEIKDVEVYSSPIKRNGKVLLHSIIHDVTEKKRNHREIIKLSKAVEQAPASILITDTNGLIEYVNPKNCSLTGYELEELIGKNPRILKSGKMPKQTYRKMWESISQGKRWSGEFYNRKKDGSYYWEQANIAPIIDDSGKIVNFIKLGKDITKQKELQEELVQAKLKAEESDRLKTSFLANLSHEVRTPLNSILGFNDLIMSKDTNEEKKPRYSKIIQESGEQLVMIIDDLVRLSQLESKQVNIKLSYFSLEKLINEIKDTYEPEISKKGIKLIVNNFSCTEHEIKADRKRIRQVLENLIRNAMKFTDQGSISLLFECTEKSVTFKVKDTGIGIAKENQDIIFERFRQVEEHYTRNYGGNGLGLAISKEIIELMGGEMKLQSEPEKGSTFSFTIPILYCNKTE